MFKDVDVLRKLALEYAQIANSEQNSENLKLHTAVNDLRMIRPVVLIDELPWNEMNINDELTLQCSDPYLMDVECYLRRIIYKHKHMPADMVVMPFIPIYKAFHSTGIGINVEEEIRVTNKENNIVSHAYKDVLQTEDDIKKLHSPVFTYDKQETMQRYNMVGEIIGDIIPVKLKGMNFWAVNTWDDIARYRGVMNLLIDLAQRPEFMHKIVKKLTEFQLSTISQFEELGLLDNSQYDLHCTAAHTDDLPRKNSGKLKMARKDIWGRGTAQIFAHVSKAMHEEFDIEYMKKTVGQCGLVYYGCCEPLDKKIDIVEKIPNLRKISITPWANVNIAAEAIQNKYVLASKPNPASVAVPMLDKGNLKNELQTILSACKKNNCSCDIVLKDISTCCNRPQNIFEWEQIAMEMVKNF